MYPRKLDNAELIAPCGLNCGICRAYLRERNKCPGCRGGTENKTDNHLNCKITNCSMIKEGLEFCYQCDLYPCDKFKHLEKRYRTKYGIFLKENFENIKILGLEKFVADEKKKWTCSECSGTICMHKGYCYNCGLEKKISE